MKRIFNYMLYAILLLYAISCKQELCTYSSQSDNSTVRFTVDWSQSNMDISQIDNISIYAYPSSGGLPYFRVSGDIESAYINLPEGVYSLLIFNDVVDDFETIRFFEADTYSGFYAELVERSDVSGIYYDIETGEVLATPQSPMAVWRMDELEVTIDMVSCLYCGELHSEEILVEVLPTPITTECVVILRIENLNNAQTIQGVVKGFASGVYMASEQRISSGESVNIYSFDFTTYEYDSEEYIDGVVEAEITTFGKDPNSDQTYELEVDIILNSGELVKFTRDITEQVIEQDNLKILITLDASDNLITLPEGNGTGFGVEEWGDKGAIELL